MYAGIFMAEDAGLKHLLADKAKSGVRVRILLGDPGEPLRRRARPGRGHR